MTIRHLVISVAVIFDQPSQSFLLCHNKRWHGYAFPMKHVEPECGESPTAVALQALNDWSVPASFPHATATPLDYLVETLTSDAVREVTIYDYHVFGVEPGVPLPSDLHPDLRLFTYQELQDAVNVTPSTKAIARSFIEDRRVASSVIARNGAAGPEFLVVYNENHGYFFPSTRIKTEVYPAEAALEAARLDLGYEGPLNVVAQAPEVPVLKQSPRFGLGERRFHYYICLLKATAVELTAPGNSVETSLNRLAASLGPLPVPYWRWCTEQQLRSDPDMSPSMPAVLLTVLHLVE